MEAAQEVAQLGAEGGVALAAAEPARLAEILQRGAAAGTGHAACRVPRGPVGDLPMAARKLAERRLGQERGALHPALGGALLAQVLGGDLLARRSGSGAPPPRARCTGRTASGHRPRAARRHEPSLLEGEDAIGALRQQAIVGHDHDRGFVARAPARRRDRAADRRCARSRLPDGSSASRSTGSFASARATATRCCSPPERRPGSCVMRPASPTAASSSSARARAADSAAPAMQLGQHDVLQRGELPQQVMELEHEPDLPAAQRGQLVAGERVVLAPIQ